MLVLAWISFVFAIPSDPVLEYTCSVTVKQAANLINVDKVSKSDPYVEVAVKDLGPVNEDSLKPIGKTHVVDNNLNPVWNYHVSDVQRRGNQVILFRVMDKEVVGEDRLLGRVSIPNLLTDMERTTRKLSLEDKNGVTGKHGSLTVAWHCSYVLSGCDKIQCRSKARHERCLPKQTCNEANCCGDLVVTVHDGQASKSVQRFDATGEFEYGLDIKLSGKAVVAKNVLLVGLNDRCRQNFMTVSLTDARKKYTVTVDRADQSVEYTLTKLVTLVPSEKKRSLPHLGKELTIYISNVHLTKQNAESTHKFSIQVWFGPHIHLETHFVATDGDLRAYFNLPVRSVSNSEAYESVMFELMDGDDVVGRSKIFALESLFAQVDADLVIETETGLQNRDRTLETISTEADVSQPDTWWTRLPNYAQGDVVFFVPQDSRAGQKIMQEWSNKFGWANGEDKVEGAEQRDYKAYEPKVNEEGFGRVALAMALSEPGVDNDRIRKLKRDADANLYEARKLDDSVDEESDHKTRRLRQVSDKSAKTKPTETPVTDDIAPDVEDELLMGKTNGEDCADESGDSCTIAKSDVSKRLQELRVRFRALAPTRRRLAECGSAVMSAIFTGCVPVITSAMAMNPVGLVSALITTQKAGLNKYMRLRRQRLAAEATLQNSALSVIDTLVTFLTFVEFVFSAKGYLEVMENGVHFYLPYSKIKPRSYFASKIHRFADWMKSMQKVRLHQNRVEAKQDQVISLSFGKDDIDHLLSMGKQALELKEEDFSVEEIDAAKVLGIMPDSRWKTLQYMKDNFDSSDMAGLISSAAKLGTENLPFFETSRPGEPVDGLSPAKDTDLDGSDLTVYDSLVLQTKHWNDREVDATLTELGDIGEVMYEFADSTSQKKRIRIQLNSMLSTSLTKKVFRSVIVLKKIQAAMQKNKVASDAFQTYKKIGNWLIEANTKEVLEIEEKRLVLMQYENSQASLLDFFKLSVAMTLPSQGKNTTTDDRHAKGQ